MLRRVLINQQNDFYKSKLLSSTGAVNRGEQNAMQHPMKNQAVLGIIHCSLGEAIGARAVEVNCPFCKTRVQTSGTSLTCPGCGKEIVVATPTSSFDPYQSWFDIPHDEQPPNHYCLLGLRMFEGSPELIDQAARLRVKRLKLVAKGPQSQEAKRLLHEVKLARKCLLDIPQKAAYDAALRGRSSSASVPPPPPQHQPAVPKGHVAHPSAAATTTPVAVSAPSFPKKVRVRRRPPQQKRPSPVLGIVLSGIGSVVIGYLLLFQYIPKLVKQQTQENEKRQQRLADRQTPIRVAPAPRNVRRPSRNNAFSPQGIPNAYQNRETARQEPQKVEVQGATQEVDDIDGKPDRTESQEADGKIADAPPETVLLDLSKRNVFVKLPDLTEDGREVTIVGLAELSQQGQSLQEPDRQHLGKLISGCRYELTPVDGVVKVGNEVIAAITDKNGAELGIFVQFALTRRGNADLLRITPKIVADGDSLDFNLASIKRSYRSLDSEVRKMQGGIVTMQRQLATINSWLASRVAKDAAEKSLRLDQRDALNKQIPAAKEVLKLQMARGVRLQRLANFAEQLHNNTQILYLVGSDETTN